MMTLSHDAILFYFMSIRQSFESSQRAPVPSDLDSARAAANQHSHRSRSRQDGGPFRLALGFIHITATHKKGPAGLLSELPASMGPCCPQQNQATANHSKHRVTGAMAEPISGYPVSF
ncbi:hypothetical protein AAFF_G00141790 [Aldrovandia affinis]|uniref:Uncharacterized protein n=1 Tax=Aldrovandia affinis TaxID=143900 RepID=A0AAD7X314_9TELE|nr:hypothetical protein AAFF_G00141790 [Aldrovandia affinis]